MPHQVLEAVIDLSIKGSEEVTSKAVSTVRAIGRIGDEVRRAGESAKAGLANQISGIDKNARSAAASVGELSKNSATAFESTRVAQYSTAIDSLNSKLETQVQNSARLGAELESMADQYSKMEIAAGRSGDIDTEKLFPELSAKYDMSLQKEQQYRDQIQLTILKKQEAAEKEAALQTARMNAADQQIAKESEIQAKIDERTQRADTNIAFSATSQAIRSLSMVSDGALGNLSRLASQVLFLKRAMTSTGSAGAAMGAAIGGGIMIAVSLISMGINALQKQAEEQRRITNEAIEHIKTREQEISTLRRSIELLKSNTSTTEDLRDAKEALASAFPELVIGYDNEKRVVLASNEVIAAQIKLKERELELDKEIAARSYGDKIKEYNEALREAQRLRESEDRPLLTGGNLLSDVEKAFKGDSGLGNAADQKEKEALALIEDLKVSIMAKIEKDLGVELPTAFSAALNGMFDIENPQSISDESVRSISEQFGTILEMLPSALRDQALSTSGPTAAAIGEVFQEILSSPDLSAIDTSQLSEQISALLDSSFQEAVQTYLDIKAKMEENPAVSSQEMQQYQAAVVRLRELDAAFGGVKESAHDSYDGMVGVTKVMEALGVTTLKSAADYQKWIIEQKAAKKTTSDIVHETKDLTDQFKNLHKEVRDIGGMKGAMEIMKSGSKGTKDYGKAIKYLADQFGVTREEIAANLPYYENEIAMKEAIAQAEYATAAASAAASISTIQAMQSAGTVTAQQATVMINALQGVINKFAELAQQEVSFAGPDGSSLGTIKPTKYRGGGGSRGGGGGGGGGGGSSKSRQSALEKEISLLDHKKKLDQVTYVEEIAWLERVLKKYAKTTDEKRELTERLYEVRKEKARADIDYRVALDQMSLREELKSLEKLMATYKKDTAARRELEQEVYEKKKELERQEYDLKVYYGQLTLAQQEANLKKMVAKYKAGTQERIDLEKQLHDVQRQIQDRNISDLDKLFDSTVNALKARYEEQKKLEEERIKESISNWKEWGDEQISAINDQIKALDELTKEEDRSEEERRRRKKIAALELQIQHERDAENQYKLSKQLAQEQDDLNKWLLKNERDDQKASLQEQIQTVNEMVSAEHEKLNAQLEANNKYYDELTKTKNLEAEAQKTIMESSQKDLLKLIKNFAPEYDALGKSFGERFVDSFSEQVKGIEKWFSNFNSQIAASNERLAAEATAAADAFWKSRGVTDSFSTGNTFTSSSSEPRIAVYISGVGLSERDIIDTIDRADRELAMRL